MKETVNIVVRNGIVYNAGDKLYVGSSYHISRGEDDVDGGLATIEWFEIDHRTTNEYNQVMVAFKEIPHTSYNLQYLLERQEDLKEQFGEEKAKPNPDINTPWIQAGDIVNGEVWKGKDVW